MKIDEKSIENRIHGGFIGRVVGSTMGTTVENWSYEDIKKKHGTIDEYIGFVFDAQGHIPGIPNDDEMFEIVLLMTLEERGNQASKITTIDIAKKWLDLISPNFTFTAEKVAIERFRKGQFLFGENLVQGNPYYDFIGAQMRAEMPGWVNPGNMDAALKLAKIDAEVSHAREGIIGELFISAIISNTFIVPLKAASFTGKIAFPDLQKVIEKSKAAIPVGSLYAKVITRVETLYKKHPADWETNFLEFREFVTSEILDELCKDADKARQDTLRRIFRIHVLPNAGIIMLALLHGQGDFSRSLEICADCGMDADCNCGNVGAILGTMLGPENIPGKWKDPLDNRFLTLTKDAEEDHLDAVARRIYEMSKKMRS
nr:ADP-ribosylglycohydrolase family protein [Candidatus Sigynarchaeota archaeon]